MNDYRGSLGIVRRLGELATLLLALGSTSSSWSSLELRDLTVCHSWDGSDASVTAGDTASSRLRAAEVALAEVRTTRAILEMQDLLREPSFVDEFLKSVGTALKAYDASPQRPEHLTALATSLAIARAALQGHVSTLPRWAAIGRTAGTTTGRYVRVPERFLSREPFSIAREAPPTPAEVAALFEFDHVAGA